MFNAKIYEIIFNILIHYFISFNCKFKLHAKIKNYTCTLYTVKKLKEQKSLQICKHLDTVFSQREEFIYWGFTTN